MICSKCGASLPEGSKVCSMCGTVLEAPVAQTSKPKSKLPIIIIVAIILVIAAFVGGLLFGKSLNKNDSDKKTNCQTAADEKKDKETLDDDKDKEPDSYSYKKFDSSKIEISYDDKQDLSKNIEILGYFHNDLKEPSKYEKLQIYGKNNNGEPVDLDLSLQYYDKNGTRLGEQTDSGNNLVKAGSEFVIDTNLMDDREDYTKIVLVIKATKKPSYMTDIEIKPEDISLMKLDNGSIEVYIKNNSGTEAMYGNGGFVFYKGGKVVYATSSYFDTHISVGGTSKGTLYANEISNGKYGDEQKLIEYDDVKFIVFSLFFSDEKNY